MKAEELMLGDWVMLYDHPRKVDVDCIEEDCNELKPIPLTAEILKKNGFTNCETTELTRELGNELWYPGEDNYISDPDLMINLGKHSFLVRFAGSIVWNLHYVHELQHFLRLVDYDKEIVL